MTDDIKARLKERMKRVQTPGNEGVAPMIVKRVSHIAVKAAELRAVCQDNPSHPQSAAFQKAVRGLPDDAELTVELADLTGVLENYEVVINEREQVVGGQLSLVQEKTTVSRKPGLGTAAPPKAPKKDD